MVAGTGFGGRGGLTWNLSDTHILPPACPGSGVGGAWECTSKSGHTNRLAHSLDTVNPLLKAPPWLLQILFPTLL